LEAGQIARRFDLEPGTIMDSVQPDRTARDVTPRLGAADKSEHPRQSFAPPPSGGRRAFWFVFVLVIAALLIGGAAYYEYVVKPAMMAQFFQPPPPTEVETATATTEDMPRAFESIGTLTAVHQVTVSPELAGRVLAITFESGATVKAGDALVQIDDATERADLAIYQAQARLAQANLARQQKLAQSQFSTKASIDDLRSQLDQANAGIMKSQATIQYKLIKAPFDGVLGIRQINLGEYLSAGTAIVTVTDLDNLYVDFTLPEQNRAELTVNQVVEFHADAFPGRTFQGAISAIDPQVDPNMRAVKVRAAVANADHALQPGMYARISVILPPQPNVVTVPEPAIDYTVYGESVYRVKEAKGEDGKAKYSVEQVFVTLGTRSAGKIAILKGIDSGDRVVVGGQLKLHNGAAVALSEQKSLTTPTEVPKE
jgi:multidrug efflux system membrane fusion protein